MDDIERAAAALVTDLYWQLDQLPRRGVKNRAGHPYNPSYYKRGLERARDRGGLAVRDYIRGFLYEKPSDGFLKLEDADSLDLACEFLVADETKPYASLFTDMDRQAARARLAPHRKAIERRKAASRDRISRARSTLPAELPALKKLAEATQRLEEAVAINEAIVNLTPEDLAAWNRLGRAHESLGALDEAEDAFREVLARDPTNGVASRRLAQIRVRRRH